MPEVIVPPVVAPVIVVVMTLPPKVDTFCPATLLTVLLSAWVVEPVKETAEAKAPLEFNVTVVTVVKGAAVVLTTTPAVVDVLMVNPTIPVSVVPPGDKMAVINCVPVSTCVNVKEGLVPEPVKASPIVNVAPVPTKPVIALAVTESELVVKVKFAKTPGDTATVPDVAPLVKVKVKVPAVPEVLAATGTVTKPRPLESSVIEPDVVAAEATFVPDTL